MHFCYIDFIIICSFTQLLSYLALYVINNEGLVPSLSTKVTTLLGSFRFNILNHVEDSTRIFCKTVLGLSIHFLPVLIVGISYKFLKLIAFEVPLDLLNARRDMKILEEEQRVKRIEKELKEFEDKLYSETKPRDLSNLEIPSSRFQKRYRRKSEE